jgi:hypothetical protein
MFASVIVGLWTWLVRIRPYVMRSGETPITGASWGVSAWADWQQCSEFAKAHDDPPRSPLGAHLSLDPAWVRLWFYSASLRDLIAMTRQPSNQSLQLTADRFDAPLHIMKTPLFQPTLAPASGS